METSRDYRALEEERDDLANELEEKTAKLVIAEDSLRERIDQLETQERERNVLNVK